MVMSTVAHDKVISARTCPVWRLNRNVLKECDVVKYLGVNLSHRKPHAHVNERVVPAEMHFTPYKEQGCATWKLMLTQLLMSGKLQLGL
ncbi:hypothetical protein E2C01_066808 [Portunus trituberculatus]|uniref:Uncharacterized protein n=1 Tax=Portunus trituberculatus TaxID=210409 RepID=A0A5B7HRW1_PORTR|nr:hypothetical protein [Portunus trituberculatus]